MKQRNLPIYLICLLALIIVICPLIWGSGIFQIRILPGFGNEESNNPIVEGTDLDGFGTIEVGIEPTSLPSKNAYTNQEYAFSFEYPETWQLTEEDHTLTLRQDVYQLHINYRWSDESFQESYFGRTGVGAGDFLYSGKISFLNQVVPVEKLDYEDKTKAVFFGGTSLVEVGNLEFVLVLEDLDSDYLDVDIPKEVIAEATEILESFQSENTELEDEPTVTKPEVMAFLKVPKTIEQGNEDSLILQFLLENQTDQSLYVLNWNTPLEGMANDIFEVTRDGQPVAYTGPVVSRTDPTPESYVLLGTGNGVTAEVKIADYYDFSQIGTYTIHFRSPEFSHIATSESELADKLEELGPINISSPEVTIEVVAPSSSNTQENTSQNTTEDNINITDYGIQLELDQFEENAEGYSMQGRISWTSDKIADYGLIYQDMVLRDSEGKIVPFNQLANEIYPGPGDQWIPWNYQIEGKAFDWPLVLTLDKATLVFNVSEPVTFQFEPGENPQFGQTWDLDLDIELGNYKLTVISVEAVKNYDNVGYKFTMESEDGIALVRVMDYENPMLGGGGGGGFSDEGPFTTDILYQSKLPEGTITVSIITYYMNVPGPWQLDWTP